MNTRPLVVLLPFTLLSLVACSGGSRADTNAAAPRGVPVRTTTVQARDLVEQIVLTGTLKPRAQVQVVAEVQARLLRVLRDEGARVAKGETLAVLDDTDYRLASDRARAALAVAEANRAHAVAEKQRADNLLKTGGITERDHLSAQVALQVAEASLAQARAEAAIAGQQLARTQVKAPFAGRVAKRFPDPGAVLAVGAPLCTLVDDSMLEFRSSVPSADYSKVKLGAPASVSVDALPGTTIAGKVARVLPLVEERSRSFEVVVEVPGRDGLPGGLFARAAVQVGVAKAALVVPPRTLLRDGSSPTEAQLFAVVSGKADRRTVTLGVETAEAVQVTSGLAAGEEVVLDPPSTLGAGAPVDVQKDGGGGGER
jgi:RND family efflux transporter MFP subunit